MDSDIHFFKQAPPLIHILAERGYPLIMHTAVHTMPFNDEREIACAKNIEKAAKLYKETYNIMPVSQCFRKNFISFFYGNFVIYSTALMTSARTLRFADFLFYNYSDGYFKHRWSDQASVTALVCHSLKVNTNLQGDRVSFWNGREVFFEHKKRPRLKEEVF